MLLFFQGSFRFRREACSFYHTLRLLSIPFFCLFVCRLPLLKTACLLYITSSVLSSTFFSCPRCLSFRPPFQGWFLYYTTCYLFCQYTFCNFLSIIHNFSNRIIYLFYVNVFSIAICLTPASIKLSEHTQYPHFS